MAVFLQGSIFADIEINEKLKAERINHSHDTAMIKIPGLSFSLKRALGLTAARQNLARKTGIPTTRGGIERKIGSLILKAIFKK